ncbi:MAG TPA: VOC family protein [Baekduia sp.]|uniref:VOC family protein n=1 Tax=Baekduia sp. TaxID=2600305 RepID=UPI002CC4E9DE|nr:VOC family protein [Baekduia sp.]HMJ37558.1 VOC family protein [Baekduia sp.]
MSRPRLVELDVAGVAEDWTALGFAVDGDGRCRVGPTDLLLRGGAGGIEGWALHGAIPADDGIDGVPTAVKPAPDAERSSPAHPNGTVAIDHVVVMTPDTVRTFEAFEAAGFELRAVRDAGTPEQPLRQGFLLTAEAIVEVVGPPEPDDDGPSRLWGITFVVADLDATCALLGAERVSGPRDAVQPGRRIASVRRAAGLTVPVAFMTPRA